MKRLMFTILAAAALLTGCNLQEKPYGLYSDSNFYKSEADAESGLLYAYNALTFLEYSRGIFYLGDIPTETMRPKSDEAGDVYQLENWIAGRETEQLIYYFKYCYISINRANTVLAHTENSQIMSPEARNRIVGEAYFLRAWNYFNLVRAFGIVPVQRQMVDDLSKTTPASARNIDELYDLIFADLEKADRLLSVNKTYGRADKVAAEALMSKAYLHLASSKEHNVKHYRDSRRDPQVMYDSAAYWSGKVIRDYNDSYYFDDDLHHIYDVNAPQGPEHIFIMPIERSGTQEGNYSKLPLMFLPSNNSVPFYIRYGNGSLLRANGNGWGVFICEDSFVNSFETTDMRRTELIHRTIYDASGTEIVPNQVQGYFSVKYVDPDFIGEQTSARPYLIRFSDIALVYAEAAGPEEGLQWVNAIRQRAGVQPLPANLDIETFRRFVIRERAFELAFEGNRLWDLRRTASVTETDVRAAGLSEEETAFFPIPQREIDLNPNL